MTQAVVYLVLILVQEGDTDQVKCLAAETIASCALYSRNRALVRQAGGIEKLVALLRSETSEDGASWTYVSCSTHACVSQVKMRMHAVQPWPFRAAARADLTE